MKKIILTIIICGILFTSIGVIAGSYNAKQVSFTSNDSTWKVNNVEEALLSLKEDKNNVITGEKNINFGSSETINLGYKPTAVITVSKTSLSYVIVCVYIENKENYCYNRSSSNFFTDTSPLIINENGFTLTTMTSSSWGNFNTKYYVLK